VPTSLRGIAVADAEARLSEEPGARKPHAGIRAGGGWATALPTATALRVFAAMRNAMNDDNPNIQSYLVAIEHARYEGQMLWQIFTAFLLAHTVFLAFLLQTAFVQQVGMFRPGVFIAGIVGLLLCIPWIATYQRSTAYYRFRMAQAREAEPTNYRLLKGVGEEFSTGKKVKVDQALHQLGWLARKLNTSRSIPALIVVFALVYLSVLFTSGPWW